MNDIELARLRHADLLREADRARRIRRARTGERWWVRSVGRWATWTRKRRRPRLVLAGASATPRRAR